MKLIEQLLKESDGDERVLLHVSDWNLQDKYYHITRSGMREFKKRLSGGVEEAWEWLSSVTWYDNDDGSKDQAVAIATRQPDMDLDQFFFDFNEPEESSSEWEGL